MKLTDWIRRAKLCASSPEKLKYYFIIGPIALVRIVLAILFGVLRIPSMALLNVCSVAVYTGCLAALRRSGRLIYVFYVVYFEIIVHSFLATICVGWRFGFSQYIVMLIPFGYYMCYELYDAKKRYRIATLMGVVAFLAFVGCRLLSMGFGAVCQVDLPTGGEAGIYIFNAICNFTFLFMVTAVFIAEIQEAAAKLQDQNAVLDKLASIDPLTGLYNRRCMQVFLEQALEAEREHHFCIVMCDIDDFKKVNDVYGHDFGDNVLKELARIMERRVSGHGFVCRWGGEEILILINDCLEEACQIAERIRLDIGNRGFPAQNRTVYCTVTVGVARHRIGDTLNSTIIHADNNLYHGKRHGKNRVVSLEVHGYENV